MNLRFHPVLALTVMSLPFQFAVTTYADDTRVPSADCEDGGIAGVTIPWEVASDFKIDIVAAGLRLPVNIAFVPNPDQGPDAPLYYVAELYGSIQVVKRNGERSTFASGMLDYNPTGPIAGTGEQGLTGIAVERDTVNPAIYHLYVTMLWDNGSPPGAPNHYPKIERLDSASGGLTLANRVVLLNMQPEIQGQEHLISNTSIGPDDKLYVHMGDGFNSSTALNLDQFRGKILRMNKNGTPVSTGDPAGANPFYNAADGINSRDYIYTYGHRNPFGGAWQRSANKHYIVECGNAIDRLAVLTAGQSFGWAGNDTALSTFRLYNWTPAVAPVNIEIIQTAVHGNSGFPPQYSNRAYVTQSGPVYGLGPGTVRTKCITEFSDLVTVDGGGLLTVPPRTIARYIGTGRASAVALAAGPDGLYFSDFYEDTGANGATATGAMIYRLKYRIACLADIAPISAPDNTVNVQDLLAVIGAWGSCADPQNCPTDIAPPGGDNAVNVQELLAVIAAWGTCP